MDIIGMNAPDKWLYEYCLVRYVPCPERGEFLNIGMVMMCKRQKWLKGKIHIDAERVKAFYPKANVDALLHQASLFERNDVPANDLPTEEKYRWLAAEKSACIRVSPSHPGIIVPKGSEDLTREESIEHLESEFNRLFSILIEW